MFLLFFEYFNLYNLVDLVQVNLEIGYFIKMEKFIKKNLQIKELNYLKYLNGKNVFPFKLFITHYAINTYLFNAPIKKVLKVKGNFKQYYNRKLSKLYSRAQSIIFK